MLENEKYSNNPYIYEYNVIYYTAICWTLGEHGDREWVSNEKVIWVKHNIHRPEVPKQNPLGLSIYT
jgi:hypothetical protein